MTEQRYRLPDALGGGEFGGYVHGGVATFEVPGVGRVMLPEESVAEVAPPLPPEPKALASVVQIGASFFEKRDDAGINWFDVGANTWVTWEQVCSVGTPTVLVPDPFAEPVELPWHHHTDDNDDIFVTVEPAPNGGRYAFVRMEVDAEGPLRGVAPGRLSAWVYLGDDAAAEFARAVLAAATQAEGGRS